MTQLLFGQSSLTVDGFGCYFFLKLSSPCGRLPSPWISLQSSHCSVQSPNWRHCQWRRQEEDEGSKDSLNLPGDSERPFPNVQKNVWSSKWLYKGVQSVLEFQWWLSLPEKLKKNLLWPVQNLLLAEEKKWGLGKRSKKVGARIVLGITHSDWESCSHLLMDWWSQGIAPGGSSLSIMYIALGGKKYKVSGKTYSTWYISFCIKGEFS